MKYWIVTRSDCRRIAERKMQGVHLDIEQYVHPQGDGEEVDYERIQQASLRIDQNLDMPRPESSKDKDHLEGRAAPILYEALEGIEVSVLDDPGFWRYLSLRYFWGFIEWREKKAFAKGNYLKYIDGDESTECVLTRMYLRVQALGGSEYGHLASDISRSTDFWRSHVIRVRTGTSPELTRAFVKKQRDDRLKTDDLREFAKSLNRTWTNLLLNIYDDEEAEGLFKELWPR